MKDNATAGYKCEQKIARQINYTNDLVAMEREIGVGGVIQSKKNKNLVKYIVYKIINHFNLKRQNKSDAVNHIFHNIDDTD